MEGDSQHMHAGQSTFAVSIQKVSPFMQSVALVKSALIWEPSKRLLRADREFVSVQATGVELKKKQQKMALSFAAC